MNTGTDRYYDITNSADTVRTFQKMLRYISEATGNLPTIGVDGVYGSGMEAAVREFQASRGLPVTGRVDAATWRAVAEEYEALIEQNSPPLGILPFPNMCGYKIPCGERSNLVLILQIMLDALCFVYDDFGTIPLTGIYDAKTERAVKCFQRRNLMCESDCVDKPTWDALARQYNMQVDVSE